jgi:AcrR family transcriptional regulator
MDTALKLFASEGYSHCTISQLAQHAGISKGLMYNYFESKEALLAALIEDGIEDMMLMMDPNMDGQLEPEEVEGFIRKFFDSINNNLQFWSLFMSVVLQPPVKAFLKNQPFARIMERFGPMMLEYFERKGFKDPDLELLTISAMIEGYGTLLVFLNIGEEFPRETIRKLEDRMIEMFTRNPNNM